ncbi:glycosyltransferase [Planktomarina temperata]|nr:glycosyltransferase [Planktomarina temperata]
MISIIIRTLNEQKYLPDCLKAIEKQITNHKIEVIIVDSGSTDSTLNIAKKFNCKITHIAMADFSFGKSLNLGCKCSVGEILIFLSAHCIPTNEYWLEKLIAPLISHQAVYTYGRQIARESVTKISEGKVFSKYYPPNSSIPQVGFFCNNANAALLRTVWKKNEFNESVTGLEDMELARRLVKHGYQIAYVADSIVEHIHEETWYAVRKRFEREAIALRQIDASLTINVVDMIWLILFSTIKDIGSLRSRLFLYKFSEIIFYRANQYYGSYLGGRIVRRKVKMNKYEYFHPQLSIDPIKIKHEGLDV